MSKIKVVELFAGVGGFRIGLEGFEGKSASSKFEKKIKSNYEVVWSNQWEPSTKIQHASKVYEARFGKKNHSNEDISEVSVDDIPDHDLLVGGFPCQDYSVATSLHNSKGLEGKKGVLWWSIHKILEEKKNKPKFLLLENVDRLLKSPSTQRGRDFAIMLRSLNDLGYAVEWRVINAAEYGMPQRRKRVFILGYHKSSEIYKSIEANTSEDWIIKNGLLAKSFKCSKLHKGSVTDDGSMFTLDDDLLDISKQFNIKGKISPFRDSGLSINGAVYTIKTAPNFKGSPARLRDFLQNGEVTDDFFICESQKKDWLYLKGAKKKERITPDGFKYNYSEGSMTYPDNLEKPSRTIITGEGGTSPSRFKHVIESERGLRRLTPIELERLSMFPENHTEIESITDAKRAFFIGNALVVGVVEKIGRELAKRHKK